MKFGDRIKNQREKLKMSREELANKLQIKYHTLSKYETSDREPDFRTLMQLATILGISIDYILGGDVSDVTEQKGTISQEEIELIKEMRKSSSDKQTAIKLILGLREEHSATADK